MHTSFAASHLGLHWAGAAQGVEAQVRSASAGGGWTEWTPVSIEAAGASTPAHRTFGALLTVPEARRFQFRLTLSDGAGIEDPAVTAISTLDVADGLSSSTLAGPRPPATPGAVTFTREEWGADEALRFAADGREIWRRWYVPVQKIAVHHTATSNTYRDVEAAKADIRAIYIYHAVDLGWGDIGYHTLVDKWGNVYEGRYGRDDASAREVWSPGVVAGHASGHNYGSTSISLLGTFTARGEGGKPGDALPGAMQGALVSMIAWEAARHGRDPEASSDFLLFDGSWNRGLANVPGHRDCVATTCPGGNVYGLLPDIRSAAAASLGTPGPSVHIESGPQAETIDGKAVAFAWSSPAGATEFEFVLEGWRRIGTSEDIEELSGLTSDHRLAWPAPSQEVTATYSDLPAGHYTFHVRARDASGLAGFEASRSFLVDPDSTGGGGGDPEEPTALELSATAQKVKGLQQVTLSWTGASSAVNVFRDGSLIAAGIASSPYTDAINQRGGGTYTYHVCEDAEGGACSNEVTVTF